MIHKQKPLIRLAIAIREQLTPRRCAVENTELPVSTWQQCGILLGKLRRARHRGWHLAAERLQRDLRGTVQRLLGALSDIDRQLEPSTTELRRASVDDICADLIALRDEFDEVSFDRRGRIVSVTTEPIVLENVHLGPFEIRLDWDDLAEGGPDNYRVIALDSNPAASSDSVTHPHVQDEVVCEGDGRQPIRHALQQGRLLDFFVIVANLLRTYNADSPYVSLSEWHGVRCADCGSIVSDDERWTCEKCETTMCGECYCGCPGCDGIYCGECVTRCEGCDQSHCNACMRDCSRCGQELCQGCLDENERCSDCHDQETEEEDEEVLANEAWGEHGNSDAPLQPHRVGETAVPA